MQWRKKSLSSVLVPEVLSLSICDVLGFSKNCHLYLENIRTSTLKMFCYRMYAGASSQSMMVSVCVWQLTDCKAVVSVLPGQVIGTEGFQLFVSLSVVHLPRMWVEQHPDKNNQVCRPHFYWPCTPDSESSEFTITYFPGLHVGLLSRL